MHEAWMRRAIDEAETALACGEVPVGAVIVCGGEEVASAHNEREASLDPTAHAEILALRRAAKKLGRRRLNGCILYVTLEPCPMCAGAIALSGLSRVIYGAPDSQAGCAGSRYALPEDPAFGSVTPCDGGLLASACREPLDRFFDSKRTDSCK